MLFFTWLELSILLPPLSLPSTELLTYAGTLSKKPPFLSVGWKSIDYLWATMRERSVWDWEGRLGCGGPRKGKKSDPDYVICIQPITQPNKLAFCLRQFQPELIYCGKSSLHWIIDFYQKVYSFRKPQTRIWFELTNSLKYPVWIMVYEISPFYLSFFS